MSTPTTFEAHGHTWTKHTPGNPMPCKPDTLIFTLFKCEFEKGIIEVPASNPDKWKWQEINDDYSIIGWRYATPPQEVNPDYQPTKAVESDQAAIHHAGSFMKEFRKGESLNMWDDEKSTPPQEKDELARLREENANMRAAIQSAISSFQYIQNHSRDDEAPANFYWNAMNQSRAAISTLSPFTSSK